MEIALLTAKQRPWSPAIVYSHCVWKRAAPSYAFQYTEWLLREPNISAEPFYLLRSFCLPAKLLAVEHTQSRGEQQEQTEVQQMSPVRNDRKMTWFTLEGVEEMHDYTL